MGQGDQHATFGTCQKDDSILLLNLSTEMTAEIDLTRVGTYLKIPQADITDIQRKNLNGNAMFALLCHWYNRQSFKWLKRQGFRKLCEVIETVGYTILIESVIDKHFEDIGTRTDR